MIRALVLLLLLFPASAFGQSFTSGAAAGPESDGRAPWVRWEALEALPVHAFRLDASVTSGSFIIDWEAFEPSWTGLGWELQEDQAATSVTTALGTPGTVAAFWAGTEFDAQFVTPWFVAVDHRWSGWNAGGVTAGTEGILRNREPLDLGPFAGRAWTAWAGYDAWGGFYGEASAEVAAARNVLVWSFEGSGRAEARWAGATTRAVIPLWFFTWEWSAAAVVAEAGLKADLQRNILGQGQWTTREESRARLVFGWVDQEWRGPGWSVGLGSGLAVLWVENPTWTQVRTWTEYEYPWWPLPFPIVTHDKSSASDYTFEASPGWVVVFHPKAVWMPVSGVSLSLSRWLPLSGGIRLAVDGAAPSGGTSSGPPTVSAWNLWLAGTQLEFLVSW